MKTTLILIQTIPFIAYVAYVWRFKTYSISESWYKLQESNKAWMFTFFTWFLGIPMVFYAGYYGNVFFFLSGSLMSFVGVATEFKEKLEGWVHNVATIGSIILSFAATAYEGSWSGLYFFAVTVLGLFVFKADRKTWWIEIAAFFCVMLSIYFIP